MTLRNLFLLSLLGILTACSAPTPNPSDATRLKLDTGEIIGAEGAHDTYVWRGIPYAAPPVGELRWRAPQPVTPWNGTLEALEYGPACVQPDNPTAGDNAPESEFVVGVEDCLTVNVFAPQTALNEQTKLPVMVWIHGGGNIVGSAQVYDGSRLASTQDVVVVSMNYRLGLLGWIRHAALRPPGASAADQSGNFGTLDIIASLHWVQDNIALFGGDPGKVTVFGESAGGRNTWSMVQSPLAKGLFHGAIVQSGSLKLMDAQKSESIDESAPDYPSYQNNGSQLVAALVPNFASLSEVEVAAALRAKSPDEVYNAAIPHPQGMYDQPRLFLDGHVFTAKALDLFRNPDSYNAVPIITGANRDEDKLFLMFDERYVNYRFGFLPKVKDAERYNKAAALGADTWRIYSVDVPAKVITESGGAPIYTYRFDFDDHADTLADLPLLLGAGHALEIPFVFGSHDEFPWKWLFTNDEQRGALSDAMMDYWGAFAHAGDPGKGRSNQQPAWNAWQAEGDNLMIFDTQNDGGVRMANDRLGIDSVKQRLLSDTAFSAQERCEAYPLVLLNGYMVTDGYDAAEHAQLCEGL